MSSFVVSRYVNPRDKIPLTKDSDGNLCEVNAPNRIVYENDNKTYDFVSKSLASQERKHFDDLYAGNTFKPLSIEVCRRAWKEEPGFEKLLLSMGNISGKKILLLGNGVSLKELYFLYLGAKCVYTDLSVEAVKRVKVIFDKSEMKERGFDQIEFHAVDACQLPFPDDSFDIIYGCVFVHHISDLDKLFSEISRCLKPGGICRFMDHAYSPLWQFLKSSVLKPLQIYSHRKHGISPADLVATRRGGYTRREIERIQKACRFREMLYLREAFFEYVLQRGTLKLGGRFLRKLKPLMRVMDIILDKTVRLVQKYGIVLVWGFKK